MILLRSKAKVNARIDHVYKYVNDIDKLYNDINDLKQSNDINALKIENGIEFKSKQNESIYKIVKNITETANEFNATMSTESKHLKRFGNANIVSKLSSINNTTNIETVIITEKTPGFIWRVFIKLIVFVLMFQSKSLVKAYVNRIEEST